METEPVIKPAGIDNLQRQAINGSIRRNPSHTTPPYWQRRRTASTLTQRSLERPPQISLQDNTEPDSKTHRTLWAKAATINDYSIVQGNVTGIGAYVVWNCVVETLDGGPMTIRKRYSDFDDLREELMRQFPQSTSTSLPPLPPKSVIYKFRHKFLERRRIGLAYFLHCVLLNPEYSSSPSVKNFIFANDEL